MEGFVAQKLNEFETGKISRRRLSRRGTTTVPPARRVAIVEATSPWT